MNPLLLGGVAAGLILVFLGVSMLEPMSFPPLSAGERVLLIGDSIGVGLTSPLRELLEARGVSLDAHPVSGWNAHRVRALLDGDPTLRGDVVVVSLGSNDWAGIPNGDDVKAIVDTVFARGARRVLWVLGPNFGLETPPGTATKEKQLAFAQMVDAAMGAEPFPPPSDVVAQLSGDRVHLPPNGYRRFAEHIVEKLTAGA